jgi:hypothetical protein
MSQYHNANDNEPTPEAQAAHQERLKRDTATGIITLSNGERYPVRFFVPGLVETLTKLNGYPGVQIHPTTIQVGGKLAPPPAPTMRLRHGGTAADADEQFLRRALALWEADHQVIEWNREHPDDKQPRLLVQSDEGFKPGQIMESFTGSPSVVLDVDTTHVRYGFLARAQDSADGALLFYDAIEPLDDIAGSWVRKGFYLWEAAPAPTMREVLDDNARAVHRSLENR